MKYLGYLILIFCFCGDMLAQVSEIEQEIMAHKESDEAIARKGRALIKQKLEVGDFKGITEVERYLNDQLNSKTQKAFQEVESWLLAYLQGDYDKLCLDALMWHSTLEKSVQPRPLVTNDGLYAALLKLTFDTQDIILGKLNLSKMEASQKQFCILLLEKILQLGGDESIYQAYLNEESDAFLAKFEDSTYSPFVRKHIRVVFKQNTWGLGMDMSFGYAAVTSKVSDYFSDLGVMSLGYAALYKKWGFNFTALIGAGTVEKSIRIGNDIWEIGDATNLVSGGLDFSYKVAQWKKWSLAPIIGVAFPGFAPSGVKKKERPDLYNFTMGYKPTYNLGFNLDYALKKYAKFYRGVEVSDNVDFVSFRYRYCPLDLGHGSLFKGNIHCITLGYAMSTHKVKRDD